jgi:hypothetical protein
VLEHQQAAVHLKRRDWATTPDFCSFFAHITRFHAAARADLQAQRHVTTTIDVPSRQGYAWGA